MTEKSRAPNVCHACRSRKRACDKALPACGFCASHRLRCRYDVTISGDEDRQIHRSGRDFVARQTGFSQISVNPGFATFQQHPHFSNAEAQQLRTHQSNIFSPNQSVDEWLDQLCKHFLEITKLSYNDIINSYTEGVRKWLPIVSTERLMLEASFYQENRVLPPADFSVLILAILSVILPGTDVSLRVPREIREQLYMATKSAVSQVQASICTSLRLVQATLFVALREYAYVRHETAYISMSACDALATIHGVKKFSAGGAAAVGADGLHPDDAILEEGNLALATAMLQQLILCELDHGDALPQLHRRTHPNRPTSVLDPNQNKQMFLGRDEAARSARCVYSLFLLDRFFFIVHADAGDKDTKLLELTQLDREICSFLEVIMDDEDLVQMANCAHTAICIRLLFLVHTSVLDALQSPRNEDDIQKRQRSALALDATSRMMTDIVQVRGEEQDFVMPICIFYNFHTAMRHIQMNSSPDRDVTVARDIESLIRAKQMYCKLWV